MANAIVINTLNTVLVGVTIIFLLSVLGLGIWFIWFKRQFKHTIVLREKTKGATDKIFIDKYRYVKKKGEAEKIQLWKSKRYKPTPPEEAKDFDIKGNEVVEGWIIDTGEVKYIESEINDIVYLIQENKPKGKIKFDVIDTDDKEFYANVLFEAQRFKKTSFLEWISNNAGLIALVFIIMIAVAFWEDITKPMVTVADKLGSVAKSQAEITEKLETIILQRQYLPEEQQQEVKKTPPT